MLTHANMREVTVTTATAYPAGVPAFGERLRELRAATGMTLPDAAERAGMHKQTWSAFENGRRANPTLEVMRAMARALDVELAELLTDVDRD